MTQTASQIGTRVWSYAGVLKDDGLSYMAYVEQLTFLLFLKMSHELTQPPYQNKSRIPQGEDADGNPIDYDWPSLVKKDGPDLYGHYRDTLEFLSRQDGLLGTVFKEAECKIKDPAKLRRLVVDLIDREQWLSLDLDVSHTETTSSHLVLTRFLLRLGVNARRFRLRITEDANATPQLAGT